MSSNLTLSAMLSALLATGPASPGQWYQSAISAMQRMTQPRYMTYRTTVPAGDSSIVISRDEQGQAEMSVVEGPSGPQSWNVDYREADGTAAFTLADGTRALSHLAILDPTWRGAYTWLRHGIGSQVAPLPTPPPVQSPQPGVSAEPQPPLPVVAFVTAIDPHAYDIRDGGDEACSDGRPGHRVWTHARTDPVSHPLAGAVIDRASLRFCTLIFREHTEQHVLMLDLDVELHFGQVGAYYLTTGGIVTGAVRPYKRPGWFRLGSSFVYDNFTFPASLPGATFELPAS
ncbi:MAG: hypothetical protein JO199_13825 [Candidatus Eremiobacteraeota bacterium]|nr:hypothetical protein [Candidatus Eremiobacteraeota bacterium]